MTLYGLSNAEQTEKIDHFIDELKEKTLAVEQTQQQMLAAIDEYTHHCQLLISQLTDIQHDPTRNERDLQLAKNLLEALQDNDERISTLLSADPVETVNPYRS